MWMAAARAANRKTNEPELPRWNRRYRRFVVVGLAMSEADQYVQVLELVEHVEDRPTTLIHAYRSYSRELTVCGRNDRVVIPTGVAWSAPDATHGERCAGCVAALGRRL